VLSSARGNPVRRRDAYSIGLWDDAPTRHPTGIKHARTLANGTSCESAKMLGGGEWEEIEGAGVCAGGRKTSLEVILSV
jgi:hypothetical protein